MYEISCSICSAVGTRMVDILDTNLSEIYEKLTDLKVHNELHYLCFICNRRLEQCYQLQQLVITQNQMGCYNNIHKTENKYKSDNTLMTSKSKLPCTFDYLTEKLPQNVKQELGKELVDVNEFDNFHEQDIKIKYESLDSQSLQSRNTKFFEIGQSSFDQNKYKDSVNKYMCDIYPNEANSDSTLKSHLDAKEVNSKLYKCKCCSYVNIKKSNVMLHELSHKNCKSYICDICNKTFTRKYLLIIHIRTHTAYKPHVCNVCGKAFYLSGHLIDHKRTHTGEKPFACDQCNKTYSQKSHLTVHKKIHISDKSHVCDVCYRAFSRRDHLITHKRRHTGERPYVCDICYKTFARSGNLKTHKRTHTGDKPYVCDVCNKAFARRDNLKRHKNHT